MTLLQQVKQMVRWVRPGAKKEVAEVQQAGPPSAESGTWDPFKDERRRSMSGEGKLDRDGRREVDRAKEEHDDDDDGPGA